MRLPRPVKYLPNEVSATAASSDERRATRKALLAALLATLRDFGFSMYQAPQGQSAMSLAGPIVLINSQLFVK